MHYFYDGARDILGNTADIFLGLGICGILLVLLTGFSIAFIYCLAILPTDLVLFGIYFLDYILKTCMPSPNISWGTLLLILLLLGVCSDPFMTGALLNIDGKFIIIKEFHIV